MPIRMIIWLCPKSWANSMRNKLFCFPTFTVSAATLKTLRVALRTTLSRLCRKMIDLILLSCINSSLTLNIYLINVIIFNGCTKSLSNEPKRIPQRWLIWFVEEKGDIVQAIKKDEFIYFGDWAVFRMLLVKKEN